MKTTSQQTRFKILPGLIVMVIGLVTINVSGRVHAPPETIPPLILILGLVATAYGIVQVLWTAEKTVMALAGPVLLIAGLCLMAVCLANGLFAGMIASGFLAVVGAILTLRK